MTWPTSVDYGALGVYSIGVVTNTIAAGAAAGIEIFQFRWTSTTKKALIREISLGVGDTATAFTAGLCTFDVAFARAFTAAGTGGNTATLTGNNQKLRTGMATTAMGEIRFADTGALGAGTKTLDSQALQVVQTSVPATAGAPLLPYTTLFKATEGDQMIVLSANEGLVIRATVPATGTWKAGLTVKWSELQDF